MSLDTASQNHSGSSIDRRCSASSDANPCAAMNRPIRARTATSGVGRQMISIGVRSLVIARLPPARLILDPAGSAVEAVGGRVGLEGARKPEGAAEAAGAWGRTCQREPLAVDLERLGGVDEDVAVAIARARLRDSDLLMPT